MILLFKKHSWKFTVLHEKSDGGGGGCGRGAPKGAGGAQPRNPFPEGAPRKVMEMHGKPWKFTGVQ